MDEEIADQTAAINMEQEPVEEPSKNALKKANKQKKLAEEKANKSATNTTKEAARSEAKKLIGYGISQACDDGNAKQGITSIDVAKDEDFSAW